MYKFLKHKIINTHSAAHKFASQKMNEINKCSSINKDDPREDK